MAIRAWAAIREEHIALEKAAESFEAYDYTLPTVFKMLSFATNRKEKHIALEKTAERLRRDHSSPTVFKMLSLPQIEKYKV